MEQVDRIDVYSRLDELRTAVFGESVKILPDTFLLKYDKHVHHFGNGYMLRHKNRHDIILIDAVIKEHKEEIARFRESGYHIKAILLTHADLISQAYDDVDNIAKDLDTTIYIHPLDKNNTQLAAIDEPNDVFDAFGIKVYHTPGHTKGSVAIYCEFNKALFTGDSAIGSPYEKDEYYFERPPIASEQADLGLRESLRSISVDFEHLLPLHGKPQFEIDDEERERIMRNLTKEESTKNL
ncbi:MBL fold metallo-hydrolase [Nonlabens ponticola]|uniref:MBL fold metallo-hydrolase n=1 Tax=Nonlabens ponticola TaxID=2496866 RepID=A0A3S9MZ04_9FLAO|nr:MBL fold metallo-hydrolase [Nonlabens ponticola]AZQ44364.1 MBL fold metallo-hydrolase [Nonlabens ponticola]